MKFIDQTPFLIFMTVFILSCSDINKDDLYGSKKMILSQSELDEPLRPRFHYTADSGFISDPSGLVYYRGEYHLFHQYNPFDIRSGIPEHWAHAVSTDLLHWKRLPIAIHPHGGGNIWPGSTVVDNFNSSGLKTGADPVIIAFYTWQKDFTIRMAYSNDRGMNWIEYTDNPVLPHLYDMNRDPKVFWHWPTQQWIMILYTKGYEIFVSTNLKIWNHASSMKLDALQECLDFFEMPVDGNKMNMRWVVMDAAGQYYIGIFNGKTFIPESEKYTSDWNGINKEFYATQISTNVPSEDGRQIQIACMRDRKYKIPEEKFHNQMTFPCELTLRTTDQGIRLFRWPVKEIERLYNGGQEWTDEIVAPLEIKKLAEDRLLDLNATIELPLSKHPSSKKWLPFDALSFSFNIRGIDVLYDVNKQEISCGGVTAPLKIKKDRTLDLRILLDKISLEIFGNEGEMSISTFINPAVNNHMSFMRSTGGKVKIIKLQVANLKPI